MMDATHLAVLLRSLATTPSRRGVARALTGFTLAGALSPLLGLAEVDAKNKRKKKQRRRRKKKRKQEPQPFCAGLNTCIDGATVCGEGLSGCTCWVTAEAGKPFCGLAEIRGVTACSDCTAEETCIDFSGAGCAPEGGMACALPCPDPL
jgi:hypothetical protein